ncbi:hypothetical protein BJF87_12375 [Gordonia sp. CNJ-863]|nr:sigma-70 family RNA polymerase sigma factor [Gordonia sp. CNJ-863]OLT52877.1 hypothetical protein BJF87_12375 [Gordonia sp. CNJ-863]
MHLEPADAGEVSLWLSDAEFDRPTSDLIERLGGDEELLLALQLSGFADRDWNPVAEELARYGLAVITSWIHKRTIFSKVKRRTGYGLPTLVDWPGDQHTVVELADDVVIEALSYFKNNVLIAGKWDPTKGASLRTYFIGQCLFRFPNCYRRLFDAELLRRTNEIIADDDSIALVARTLHGIEDAVITSDAVRHALRSITTPRARSALVMHAQGYPYQEIADYLGIAGGAKAIENMITYQKKRARRSS